MRLLHLIPGEERETRISKREKRKNQIQKKEENKSEKMDR
jgi:hypothetical protein